ncbi:STAS domain-containing protein [Kibdelosporangium lantanae]|uniref:Anti-sigma factor antagonist n=1 Tax=Kibdelosporangium lantanae TaxID=1497396 RepID=A0ABW3MHU0_9PSEU
MAAKAIPISTVTASREGTIAVVRVVGEIDMSSVEPLDTAVRQELDAKPAGLVLDLLDVGFWGSSGIRTLLETRARTESGQTALRLVAQGPIVLRPLEICGLAPLFHVHETVPSAVRELATSA